MKGEGAYHFEAQDHEPQYSAAEQVVSVDVQESYAFCREQNARLSCTPLNSAELCVR
jgi:hypothetical protein